MACAKPSRPHRAPYRVLPLWGDAEDRLSLRSRARATVSSSRKRLKSRSIPPRGQSSHDRDREACRQFFAQQRTEPAFHAVAYHRIADPLGHSDAEAFALPAIGQRQQH